MLIGKWSELPNDWSQLNATILVLYITNIPFMLMAFQLILMKESWYKYKDKDTINFVKGDVKACFLTYRCNWSSVASQILAIIALDDDLLSNCLTVTRHNLAQWWMRP